jgi:LuxR family maltose regulon positive regulatory protein
MSTPILATKLSVAPSRPNVVLRPRLSERLDEGLQGRLILISAPAGFGKTTMISQWLAGCGRLEPEVRPAWLSLDEGDSDPARFLTYLIAALRTVVAEIGEEALGMLQSPQPQLSRTVSSSSSTTTMSSTPNRWTKLSRSCWSICRHRCTWS